MKFNLKEDIEVDIMILKNLIKKLIGLLFFS